MKHLLLSSVVFASFCFSTQLRAQKNREANNLARQGTEAANNKQWDQAIDSLRKAAEMDHKYAPNLAVALQQRASAYMAEQKFPEALADFSEALKIRPKDAGILERRAYAEMKLNDLDKALADYSEAIKLAPNEVRYYLVRSYILEMKGDYKNSMVDTEKILKLQKDNPEAQARKARLLARQAQDAPPPPNNPQPKKP
jgi:tetratricopeptide (TPR) repeat protein